MKIFANQPMKAMLYLAMALGIIFVLALVHHNRHEQKVAEAAKVAAAKPKVVVKPVDAQQLKCLTDNIYYEAANQGTLGQAAVGRVTVNRVKHGFGSSICDVVYKKTKYTQEDEYGTPFVKTMCQFSWVCVSDRNPVNRELYAESRHVAYKIMSVDAWNDLLPRNTLYFHATYISPQWGLQRVKRIGQHVFYTNNKVKAVSKNEQ